VVSTFSPVIFLHSVITVIFFYVFLVTTDDWDKQLWKFKYLNIPAPTVALTTAMQPPNISVAAIASNFLDREFFPVILICFSNGYIHFKPYRSLHTKREPVHWKIRCDRHSFVLFFSFQRFTNPAGIYDNGCSWSPSK